MTVLKLVVSLTLVAVGIVHLVPVTGVFGGERLQALYGLPSGDANLAILMRHRAVLFGLLGAFLLATAFRPAWQGPAFLAGFVSVASFLWIAFEAPLYNDAVARIVRADLGALGLLAIGAAALIVLMLRGKA